jgi:hypothetical protein
MTKLWDTTGANPWDIEIDRAIKRGIDPQKARTFVVFRWMWHGDFRPLITAIRDNQPLDHPLLNLFIAGMALNGRLTVVKKRGRPRSLEAEIRNMIGATAYENNSSTEKSDELFEWIAKVVGTSHQSVRQALTAHRKSNRRQQR